MVVARHYYLSAANLVVHKHFSQCAFTECIQVAVTVTSSFSQQCPQRGDEIKMLILLLMVWPSLVKMADSLVNI